MNEHNRSAWIKWIVGVIIAIAGAGGGIVAILDYVDRTEKNKHKEYLSLLQEWENFTPNPVSKSLKDVGLKPFNSYDFDSGLTSAVGNNDKGDFTFEVRKRPSVNGRYRYAQYIRILKKNKWLRIGVKDFDKITFREIQSALKEQPLNDENYIFSSNKDGKITPNYIYFVLTNEGNLVKFQIIGIDGDNAKQILKFRYVTFPNDTGPSYPQKPN